MPTGNQRALARDNARQQAETKKALTVSPGLAAKIASAVVHASEMISPSGHHVDKDALRQACEDQEVKSWLKALGPLAPVLRNQGHSALRARDGSLERFDLHQGTTADLITKYSNKILELDGANMDQQEIPLLLAEFVRELRK